MQFRQIMYSTILGSLPFILSSCYHPPYNNFAKYSPVQAEVVGGTAVGTGYGAVFGAPALGAGVGAGVGLSRGLAQKSTSGILTKLQKYDIQYVQYGDLHTLIVPVDRYYYANTARLKELCYKGLILIPQLLNSFPNTVIYIAGFTDNVGSTYHKNTLSQAQAETMLTFLWAHDVSSKRLHAEGYGEKHRVSDNRIIHGSAQNRRIEIQWFNNSYPQDSFKYWGKTK